MSICILIVVCFLAAGCSGVAHSPEACKDAVFAALEKDDADAFFSYVLEPPEDKDDREMEFLWLKSRFEPYIGGDVIETEERDDRVIIKIAPAEGRENSVTLGFPTAPMSFGFVEQDGWKLDVKYTEKMRDLQDLYRGIMGG
ncbi:MAG: hypothetical protein JW885_11185 [Deltaproteobacteria bacterium]|nr:hypothetical protein [Candidatus Zymogenaceae bacterium]